MNHEFTPDTFPPALAIRLFGPYDLHRAGRPLPRSRSRKELWLLALLVLRYPSSVERTWLAGLLWPDTSEEAALGNLRRSLNNLRGVLGPDAERLTSPSPRTLQLDLMGASVDVVDFDAAIKRGDAASQEQAVALYRGPLLEGCLQEWVLPERAAREQAYLMALEMLAEQAMRAGAPVKAAGYLRQVIGVDPLRERAQRGLLQALAASGDYAAAVLAYRELRTLLRRELHTEPAAETIALFEQLRVQARTQAQPQAPVQSRPQQPQVLASPIAPAPQSEVRSDLALSSPVTLPTNLPAPLSSFIGRETEIQEVKQLLSRSRLLTLTGAGGYGKTRLALQVATQVREAYPAGVWLVELAALSGPTLLPQTVASALGLHEEPGRSLTETLQEYLKAKKLLLLLDNCEHLVGPCASLAETLLRACPDLKLLATSREALQVQGEQPWRVPPMAHPAVEQFSAAEKEWANGVLEYDACRLFVERARLQQPEFALTPHNARALVQLCARLGGMPLALELAASRLRVLTLEQLCERLQDRFGLLQGGMRTAAPRHQTLRALIDWSYERLEPEEQLLLQRLSIFAGGWTLEAAEFVCGADEGVGCWVLGVGEEPAPTSDEVQPEAQNGREQSQHLTPNTYAVLDLLTSLVDKSLVVFEARSHQAGGRYRLLETILQYAQEKLKESGEAAQVRRRHREYFLTLAEAAEPHLQGSEQGEWLERLEAEHENLRTALEECLKAGDRGQGTGDRKEERVKQSTIAEAGLRMAGALWQFWQVRGYRREGRAYLEQALGREGAIGPTQLRAKALHGAATLAWNQGDYGSARALFEQSLAIQQELGDRAGMALSFRGLGNMAQEQGDYGSARALTEQSLAICQELGDKEGIAALLSGLGNMALDQGDHATAWTLGEQSLAIRQELGDKAQIASSLASLGQVARAQRKYATAKALLEQSLSIKRESGDKAKIALNLVNLGFLEADQGHYEAAGAFFEQSLVLRRELGSQAGIASSLIDLGNIARAQRNYAVAQARYEQSLAICLELSNRRGTAICWRNLGHLAREQGDYVAARARYEQSLAIMRNLGDKRGIAQSLEAFARLRRVEEQPQQAVQLWAVAQAWRDAMGWPLLTSEQEEYERDLTAARDVLGEEPFAAAWVQGQALTMEQAMAFALKAPERA